MFSRAFLLPFRLSRTTNIIKCVPNSFLYKSISKLSVSSSFHSTNNLNVEIVNKHDATSKKPATNNENTLLFQQNDPDVFGTLTEMEPFDGRQTTKEEDLAKMDPLDFAEEELLEKKPFRTQRLTVKKYGDLIKNHFKYKRVKEAIDVLEVKIIKEDRVKPNDYLFNLVISGCARLGYSDKAFKLYNRMKERDLKISGATYTALFNACAESPFPQKAIEQANNLRKIMLQVGYIPNESNYNAMIKAYGRCGDIETAFQLVDEMKDNKLQLNLDTINFLLQACASNKEFGFRHALLTWHKMYKLRFTPDRFSFGLMLRCTRDCDIGDIHETRRIIMKILADSKVKTESKFIIDKEQEVLKILPNPQRSEQKVKIEDSSSNEFIDSESNSSKMEENISNAIVADDQVLPKPSEEICDQTPNLLSRTPHLGSLVALSAVKSASDRLLLLGGMSGFVEEMKIYGVVPDIKLFTILLEVIPSTKAAENKLIQIIRKDDIPTDVDFFNILMKKRAMRFDYEAANEVLDMIQAARLEPNIVTYGVMCLGCKSAEEAQNMLQTLQDAGVRPNMIILGSMLKNACYLRNYDYALEILHNVEKENLKLSGKFLKIIDEFNRVQFLSLRSKKCTKRDQNEYFRFSREYKHWKKNMQIEDGVDGMKKAIKLADVHPWKQFKEQQSDGIENVKNIKKFRKSKTKHKLYKLTGNRLKNFSEKHSLNDETALNTKEISS